MKTIKELNAAPDLALIDEVIKQIKTGKEFFMCVAFSNAGMYRTGQYYSDELEYRTQLDTFVISKYGERPEWWSRFSGNYTPEENEKNKKARVKILQEFRQACIEAGKRK